MPFKVKKKVKDCNYNTIKYFAFTVVPKNQKHKYLPIIQIIINYSAMKSLKAFDMRRLVCT